ncbi:hypothetical protein V7S43_013791 [Phytophthora oleae]|uniref:Uncharacterized protein n=1 Tax=Phytophthora oleae TaxID=2107226 RepID=A0ABD3F4J4_9STRA
MNIMNARQYLAEKGYIVLYKAVSDEDVNELRSIARSDGRKIVQLHWNNATWNGEAFDTLRPRALLPKQISRELTISFRRHYLTFFPHTTASEWSYCRQSLVLSTNHPAGIFHHRSPMAMRQI